MKVLREMNELREFENENWSDIGIGGILRMYMPGCQNQIGPILSKRADRVPGTRTWIQSHTPTRPLSWHYDLKGSRAARPGQMSGPFHIKNTHKQLKTLRIPFYS